MKTLEEQAPAAIVARAEGLEAVSKIAKEIGSLTVAALKARAQSNRCGLEIGRLIIGACFDEEVKREVIRENNSEKRKLAGGAPAKVYNFVARQVADKTGYHREYMQECARQYLGAFNRRQQAEGTQTLELSPKEGVFQDESWKTPLPPVSEVEKYLKPVTEPAIDDLAPDAEPEAEDTNAPQAQAEPLTESRVREIFLHIAEKSLRMIEADANGVNLNTNKKHRAMMRNAYDAVLENYHFSLNDHLVKGD